MDYKSKYLKYKNKYLKLKEDAWSAIINTQLFKNDIDSVMVSQGKTFDEALDIVKNNIINNPIKNREYYKNSPNSMNDLGLIPKYYNFPYIE
jgi:hypothetical protein